MIKQDALGNEIKLGDYYGYSTNSNGVTFIRVGEAIKLNEKLVTLRVILSKSALYSANPTPMVDPSNKISIKANMLFPVDIKLININP